MTLRESRCYHKEGPRGHWVLLAMFLILGVWPNDGWVQLAGTNLKTFCVFYFFFFDVIRRKVRTTSVTM